MGKIPVLETADGCIGETVAILDYLDDAYPEPALRPDHPFLRARQRQAINIIQVYVEAPARTLFPGVFAVATNEPATVAGVRAVLDRATAALQRLLAPGPYLLGASFTATDIFAFYNFDLVDRLTRFVYGRSLISEIGLGAWHEMIAARESSRIVLADFELSFAQYLADRNAPYSG